MRAGGGGNAGVEFGGGATARKSFEVEKTEEEKKSRSSLFRIIRASLFSVPSFLFPSALPDASGAPLAQSPNVREGSRAMSASLSVGGSGREGATKADACSNGSSVVAATATNMATTLGDAVAPSTTFPSSSSTSDTLFPVVDLTPLLLLADDDSSSLSLLSNNNPEALAASKLIASSLVATGCVLVRDPRVSELDNSKFLDLLERYFEQPEELKREDARPELHYQIGATPEGVERPSLLREDSTSAARARSLAEKIKKSKNGKNDSSDLPTWPAGADPKWRFFWRVGPRPAETAFPELNAPQMVPRAFEAEWAETLDG